MLSFYWGGDRKSENPRFWGLGGIGEWGLGANPIMPPDLWREDCHSSSWGNRYKVYVSR